MDYEIIDRRGDTIFPVPWEPSLENEFYIYFCLFREFYDIWIKARGTVNCSNKTIRRTYSMKFQWKSGRQSHEKINKSNGFARIYIETEAQIALLFPHRRLRIRIGKFYLLCASWRRCDGHSGFFISEQSHELQQQQQNNNHFRSLFATRVTIFSMYLLRINLFTSNLC